MKLVKVFLFRITLQVLKFLLIKHDRHIAMNQVLGEYKRWTQQFKTHEPTKDKTKE